MPTEPVFLTGATGFVGGHILRALIERGYSVRALVRDKDAVQLPCDTIAGDLRRPGELARAIDGCRYVIHSAALYSFSARLRREIYLTNVAGTAGLLEAARVAGVERAIVTSSSAALGVSRNGRLLTEADWGNDDSGSTYHNSKVAQERAAFASRVAVTTLLPTTPVGPGDAKPTPTGQLILDFMRGRMFSKPPRRGGLNLVAVEDVARAHVDALTRGRSGERYILGGENLTLDQLWQVLAEITERPMPRARVPNALLFGLAWGDELRCRFAKDCTPLIPLEGVRMAQHRVFVDSLKARQELQFEASPVRDALQRAVLWYRSHQNGI
ncbi:MAG: NAD-dependent epimerase/dehydratase family protein [Candidatus Eremiobacteraeota bacterium]|nr:NAD-dependent epimerase/dehydratase family protein [Candidatus Eremiobacteraeota bacterium]